MDNKLKFNIGDYVANDYCFGKVIEITDDAYLLDTGQGIPFSCEQNAHVWSITDAKDGDVLADECGCHIAIVDSLYNHFRLWSISDAKKGDVLVHNGCTFIFMGIKDGIVQAFEENMLEPISFGEPDKDNDYHPASKEQCELLCRKIAEAGYAWNPEKDEMEKIRETHDEKQRTETD